MKILVICQYYYPEPFRISDICEELVGRGHEVQVVTGIPNYPMGKIYDGYRHGKRRDECIGGVNIHRCFTIGRRSGPFWRFVNYYSYAISSTLYVMKLKNEYDVVFVNQLSPVMMAYAGIRYKKKYNKKLILYCLDLWPASLAAGGVKNGSRLYRYFHNISKKIYGQADKLLVSSRMFKDYLNTEFGIDGDAVVYLPEYAEEIFIALDGAMAAEKETIDFMFAGNIGAAQDVQTIIRAANELKDYANIRFHIIGDGSELENCKKLADELGLTSVVFYGRKPLEDMPRYYAMADAMLVTMSDDPVLSMTLPGKVQTYMAVGKPILCACNGETRLVIKDACCGYSCDAGDYRSLAGLIHNFFLNIGSGT